MKKIKLSNYRCYESLELEFSNKINLLIGDNASGKTTLIRAISKALSSFFLGFSDENTRFTGLEKEDFTIVRAEETLANESSISVKFEWLGQEGELVLNSVKGRTLQEPLKDIKALGSALYKDMFKEGKQVKALPMFTSFSTSDIHKPKKFSSEFFKKYEHKPSFGYFECLQGDGFMDHWTLRLLVLKEGDSGKLEIEGVTNALLAALGTKGCNVISNVDIRPLKGKVFYTLSDGRLTDTDNLSDGLKRLINIVLDISFRCMLLNKGIYGLEACAKTEGTVLIDEIDLHLHPTLQSVVMKGLQQAFPNIQFIITSHAPMIMTGIPMDDQNKIIKLGYNEQNGSFAREIETYGLDASTIIQAVLGVTPRSQEVENRLKKLFAAIDNDQYEEAIIQLNEMRSQFGNYLPELAKAEALLMEPEEWTAKKATPGFTQYESIPELRHALLEEQGHICAYCMRRIPAKDVKVDATSKIEHIISRESSPDLQLSFANMAICCPGNLNNEAHYDKSKGGNSLTFNLHTADLQKSITYALMDGSIRSSNEIWNKEINELLHLNHGLLKANRKEALSGIIAYLNTAGWTTQAIQTKLNLWRQRNAEGKHYQFCGIIIWFLEKKLNAA